jgi:capsular exopolysaccharide synthesis family protein
MGAEAFRGLRTNLQFLRLEKKGKLFLITSSFIQEGKTFNSVNLALSLAQAGKKILLVDADLRRPLVHKVFGLDREPGITDVVLGNYHWQEVTSTISDLMLGDFNIDDILKTPGMDSLHIMTAGVLPPNPTEILNSSRFQQFLQEARSEYDFIFIDSPPVLPVADPAELAPLVDGVFLVYTVGKIGRGVLKRAKSTLENVDANILGVIMNRVKSDNGPEYLQYHNQYYYKSDEPMGRKGKTRQPNQPVPKGARASKLARLAGGSVLAAAVVIVTLGIFWSDFQTHLSGWLNVLK